MYKKMFLMAGIASVLLTSCSEDNDNNTPSSESGKFLVETAILNANGMSGSTYMQLVSEFSGKVDNTKGIQIDIATPTYVYGNDVFTTQSFMAQSSSKLTKYTRSSEGLVESGSLDLPVNGGFYNIVKVSEDKAYLSGYKSGKIWVVNPKTLTKTSEIDLTSLAHKDTSPDPSYGVVRDGLYYLPLNQVDPLNRSMVYSDYLQTDVVIIDIAKNEVVKVISEKTSGLSNPVRPVLKDMIFTNENSDIYMACSGFFGMYPGYKKSGFVCIPKGKQEFDTSKSWDTSAVSIEGSQYKASTIINCKYIGNGKLVAFVGVAELLGTNPMIAKNIMPVTIDMNAKTIKQIKGIPITDMHSASINAYKDLIVFSSYGEDKSGFYTYNPANGEVKFQLSTVGNPVFFHSFE